jgi:hypothetical protein
VTRVYTATRNCSASNQCAFRDIKPVSHLHHNQNKLSGFLFCFIAVDLEKKSGPLATGNRPDADATAIYSRGGAPFTIFEKTKGCNTRTGVSSTGNARNCSKWDAGMSAFPLLCRPDRFDM